jgi:hypothetical protein
LCITSAFSHRDACVHSHQHQFLFLPFDDDEIKAQKKAENATNREKKN